MKKITIQSSLTEIVAVVLTSKFVQTKSVTLAVFIAMRQLPQSLEV